MTTEHAMSSGLLPVDPAGIPAELKARAQWVVWRLQAVKDRPKPTKVLYNPHTGTNASATDPGTWAAYAVALAAYEAGGWDGVGYVFAAHDPFAGLDIDGCRDPETGAIDPEARRCIDQLASYTEASPSGTGVHVFVRATLPAGRRRIGPYELYDSARYFTVTGHRLAGSPAGIEARQAETDALHARLFTQTSKSTEPRTMRAPEPAGSTLTDDQILERARNAANGGKFFRLWVGDISGHGNDHSGADQALANMLAFWTQDAGQIDRLFRQSGLHQHPDRQTKWNKVHFSTGETYGQRTITKAIDGLTERWEPGGAATGPAATLSEPEWEPPQSLEDPPLPAFPMTALEGPVRTFPEALATATETDPALPATVTLGMLGTAAGNKYEIEVDPGYTEPTNLYIATFLPSGSRKSQVFKQAQAPVLTYERKRAKEDRAALVQWETDHEIAKKEKAKLEQEASGTGVKAENARLKAIAHAQDMAANKKPVVTKIIADDATAEKLASLLVEQGGFISVMSPEGGALFGNIGGRYNSKGMPNLDTLLKAHNAEEIRVDRTTRESEYIPRATINMVITPQPTIARDLGQIPGFWQRGGAARMLASFPASNIGYRTFRTTPVPDNVREDWHRLITAMLELKPTRMTDSDGFQLPCKITLSPEARAILWTLQDEYETLQRPGAPLHGMTDWAGKSHGAAARIAGLLHIARHALSGHPEDVAIEADTMRNAVTIMRYFTAHAQVFFDQLRQAGDLTLARAVWAAIRDMPAEKLTKQKLYQRLKDRRTFRTADTLDTPLTMLEDLGYIRAFKHTGDRGGRPSIAIHVNPVACTQNPHNPQNPDTRLGSGGYEGFESAYEPMLAARPLLSPADWPEALAEAQTLANGGADAVAAERADVATQQATLTPYEASLIDLVLELAARLCAGREAA